MMKLLVFSIGPIFPELVHGGSQKVLVDIASGLGKQGWKVDILSPPRDGCDSEFSISENVKVYPVLPLRGSFPTPYGVSPFRLSRVNDELERRLPEYDLFYVHDGSLLLNSAKHIIPTVISLRDFCYQETLLGAMNFDEAALIVNSIHTRNCLLDSFGRQNPRIEPALQLVYNGYSPEQMRRTDDTAHICDLMGLGDGNGLKLIGFPHRPDVDKGFSEALRALRRLADMDDSIRLCVPIYMDAGVSDRAEATYSRLNNEIASLGLERHVLMHNWVPHQLMNEYYSLCSAVWCVGSFVESFSNVAVEALLCGTPVIATNVATYRTMPGRQFMTHVEYSDTDAIADKTLEILQNGGCGMTDGARAYISEHLGLERMVAEYGRIFKSAASGTVLPVGSLAQKRDKLRLTAWCCPCGHRIYNDYKAGFEDTPLDGALFAGHRYRTEQELLDAGTAAEVISGALADGIIIDADPTWEKTYQNKERQI